MPIENPQKSCQRSVPKNRVFPPFAGGETDKTVKIGKSHPYPPLTTHLPPKNLKNLLDALDFGEYC